MRIPSPIRLGIQARTALLSWLIATGTVVIFTLVMIPTQKRSYQQALESKAFGVAASIRDLQGSALVNHDYATVVDNVCEVLEGDAAVYCVVLAASDGYGMIFRSMNRGGWFDTNALSAEWRPADRVSHVGIQTLPTVNKRIYNFSHPLTVSGIDWGWIHVGLSLEDYDRSVASVYRRTLILAVICIVLSLLASTAYARLLVQPVLSLKKAVGRVALGDLSARSDVRSEDELGSLAQSFNSMADAMLKRDRILESVRFAAQRFLGETGWSGVIDDVLAEIGKAAEAHRGFVFEALRTADGRQVCSQSYVWSASGVPDFREDPSLQEFDMAARGFGDWADQLRDGQLVSERVSDSTPAKRELFDRRGTKGVLLIPIRVQERWWGFFGFEDCVRDRSWTPAERDSLRTTGEMLGAAIARQISQDELIEAKETLEQRVMERTQELSQQVAAKEQARSELARTQSQMVELSRLSGMAEVATGVLHNVGNVLNSVNVTANLLRDWSRGTKVHSLTKAANLLRQHQEDLGAFLTGDTAGKQIPAFLIKLSEHLETEVETVRTEVDALCERIEHIKQIVTMQQGYARVAGMRENLSLRELAEDAIRMTGSSLTRHGVQVVRKYSETPPVLADRHALLQILINLIRNAKDAMSTMPAETRRLTITLETTASDCVRVTVQDTGIGIARENLTRIFSHGFTTKRDGHGFGLHSGANAAKQMGGRLFVHSDGPGHGALFVLELPRAGVPAAPLPTPAANLGEPPSI
ncbi:MAG: HAMP domain-containing protein [Verrucomicrobiales bacterium]|nr:HAMP domain-containing protein [Verrucomicrobiales bacterium]